MWNNTNEHVKWQNLIKSTKDIKRYQIITLKSCLFPITSPFWLKKWKKIENCSTWRRKNNSVYHLSFNIKPWCFPFYGVMSAKRKALSSFHRTEIAFYAVMSVKRKVIINGSIIQTHFKSTSSPLRFISFFGINANGILGIILIACQSIKTITSITSNNQLKHIWQRVGLMVTPCQVRTRNERDQLKNLLTWATMNHL